MIYFTADTHFGSEPVRVFNNRPFKNTKQMDRTIIKNWNKVAKNDDTIYHLGDFGNYDIVKKLRGKIILISGNYEVKDASNFASFSDFRAHLISKGFFDVIDEKGTDISLPELDANMIHLTHKPLDCNVNLFNLFGHVHILSAVKEFGINVGIDCFHYRLADIRELKVYKHAIESGTFDENVYCSKEDLIKLNNA
ncbi:MAG: metallophosphoesterase family protein [Spirochaetales bacterium]